MRARTRPVQLPKCHHLLALFLLVLTWDVLAAPREPLDLNAVSASEPLYRHVSILRDPTGEMFYTDALERGADFVPAEGAQDLSLGYTHDTLWLRLDVTSSAEQPRQWLIELEYPYVEHVLLHRVNGSQVTSLHAGAVVPPPQRAMRHRQAVFPVELAPGEQVTLLLQVRTRASMTLTGSIWETQAFHEQDAWVSLTIAVYLGMLLAFGLYNLLLWLGTRQASFLFYSLFVLSFATAVLTINGIGPLYLWPGMGATGSRMLPFGFTLSAAFAMLFARSFLNTAEHLPRWDSFLLVAGLVACVMAILCLVLPLQLALYQMSLLGISTTLILFSIGLYCVYRGVPGARIFVLAWTMLLAGTSMLALRNLGLLPSNVVTLYSIQFGSALEMLLLSLGLATRFNHMKQQREQAQQELVRTLRAHEMELEQRVDRRTRELAEANAKLSRLATRDALTGLANRTGLDDHLNAAMVRTARRGEQLALLMVDLDGFKGINDTHGHEAGDDVLREVAERMTAVSRESDFIARFGGDEFVIVAEQVAGEAAARVIAERIRVAIADQPFGGEHDLHLGASIGISLSDGENPGASQLMREADVAMYRRKRAGKSGVTVFSAS